jgi:hypothetical protein
MSRTYRRQKGYIPNYVKEAALPIEPHKCIGYDTECFRFSRFKFYRCMDYRDGQWFDYNAVSLAQHNARWFGDHGYAWRRTYGKDTTKFTRNHTQVKYRAEARMELKRFEKNPDYEVQIPRKNLLPWD